MFGPCASMTYEEVNDSHPYYAKWLIEESLRVDRLASQELLRFVHWIITSGQVDRTTGQEWRTIYNNRETLEGINDRGLNFLRANSPSPTLVWNIDPSLNFGTIMEQVNSTTLETD